MDEIMQCTACSLEYDTESRKPSVGKCGHSICSVCANDKKSESCPVCGSDGSFKESVVNLGLMNVMELKNKKEEGEVEGTCSLCKKETKKLSMCIDCGLNNEIIRPYDSDSDCDEDIEFRWKTGYLSLEQCIQKAALSTFCEDCSTSAIHNRHETNSFKSVQKTLFSNVMNFIKGEMQRFLNSFDKEKDERHQKLEDYRKNISSLLDYVTQLSVDEFTNYPKRVVECIEKLKVLSNELASCHHNISNLVDDIEKKLEDNAHLQNRVYSKSNAEKEENIFHLKRSDDKLEIYVYNTISNTMQMETQISVPKYSNSIVYKNNVYIIGGHEDGNYLKTVEVYNLNDKTRRKLVGLIEARDFSSACTHNGKLVVYGGYKGSFLQACAIEEYNLARNKWKIIGKLSTYSTDYHILSHDNHLYAVGKVSCSDCIAIMKFDKGKSEFEEINQFYFPMNLTDCISFNGKIYIIGRKFHSDEDYSIHCHYNPSTDELSEEKNFKILKGVDAKLYSLNNQLYVIDTNSVAVLTKKNYISKWKLLWSKK